LVIALHGFLRWRYNRLIFEVDNLIEDFTREMFQSPPWELQCERKFTIKNCLSALITFEDITDKHEEEMINFVTTSSTGFRLSKGQSAEL